MKRIRVGVIGVGNMGIHHARVFSMIPGVEVVGVADPDPERLGRARDAHDVPGFADHRELLGIVDAVSIAVPTALHRRIAGECLERNVHVLVEKPIAASVGEGEELFALAHRHKVVLQVGHIERFNPAVQELRKIVVGQTLYAIGTRRCSPPTPQIADVDVVFDLLIHDLDIALALADAPVRSIKAMGRAVKDRRTDHVLAQVEFANGVLADLVASKITQQRIRELAVTTDSSYITLDYISRDIAVYRNASVTPAGGASSPLQHTEGVVVEKPVVRPMEPLRLELEHFIACINGAPAVTGPSDALAALRVASTIAAQVALGPDGL